jgi:hypothetical protein
MSTVLARVTVTASAAKAPVANKTTTKTVAPQQRASIGARAVAFAKTNVPACGRPRQRRRGVPGARRGG